MKREMEAAAQRAFDALDGAPSIWEAFELGAAYGRGVGESRALLVAASSIRNEVAGWERGGSYARKKFAMYQGLASRVEACLDASND